VLHRLLAGLCGVERERGDYYRIDIIIIVVGGGGGGGTTIDEAYLKEEKPFFFAVLFFNQPYLFLAGTLCPRETTRDAFD
jgi:hypothetical protein